MLARLWEFWPTAVGLVVLAACWWGVVEVLYRRIKRERARAGEADPAPFTIAWAAQHRREMFVFGVLMQVIALPCIEELIFRLPIIIAFPTLTAWAWGSIVASAVLFAAIHIPNGARRVVSVDDLVRARRHGRIETDDFLGAVEQCNALPDVQEAKRHARWFHLTVTFTLGMVCGYVGIRAQSFWLAAGAHVAWNAFVHCGAFRVVVVFVRRLMRWCTAPFRRYRDRRWVRRYRKVHGQ